MREGDGEGRGIAKEDRQEIRRRTEPRERVEDPAERTGQLAPPHTAECPGEVTHAAGTESWSSTLGRNPCIFCRCIQFQGLGAILRPKSTLVRNCCKGHLHVVAAR